MQEPKILFEDNKIIVAVKPVGMLSQSDFTQRPDILNYLKKYIKEKYNKPGEAFLGLVHRLDKEVGGVMVFARNSKSAKKLSQQILEHKFEKKYLAQVENFNLAIEGELEDYLIKGEKKNITRFAKETEKDAKKSKLQYKLLSLENGIANLEVKIITGRSHQIRAQFGLRGMAIIGDKKYGSKIDSKEKGIRLWAYSLGFINPNTDKWICFENKPKWL